MHRFIAILLALSSFVGIFQEIEAEKSTLFPRFGQSNFSGAEYAEFELLTEEVLFIFSFRRHDFLDLHYRVSPSLDALKGVHFALFKWHRTQSFSQLLSLSLLDLPPPFLV